MTTNTAALTVALPSALVARGAMTDAINIAVNVTEKRTTYPILANVLLRGDGQTLFVTATDLDIELHVAVPAYADPSLAMTVPAHMLRDLLKGAPKGDNLTITATDATTANLEFERANYHLGTVSPADWPEIKPGTMSHKFALPGADLYAALASVETGISKEETRYYLNGVYLHTVTPHGRNRAELRFVTTDGHRMLRQEITAPDSAVDMPGAIIPTKTVKLLLKLLKGKACPDTVDFEVSENRIRVAFDNVTIVSKLIEGTFPDYERVTPKNNDKLATFDVLAMLECIKAVSMIASERGGKAVKLDISNGNCTFSVTNPDHGTATSTMPIGQEFDGQFEIGFNARYLTEMVNDAKADGDAVTMQFNDAGAPALVKGARDGWLGVVMPMRV